MLSHWVRFRHRDTIGFGTVTQYEINVHDGELFGQSQPSGRRLALSDVELMAPAEPSKIIALWNNFHALGREIECQGTRRTTLPPEGADDGRRAERSRQATG